MYSVIVAASGLSAYRSESGSSSAARQRWYFGSQNTDHCGCSRRRPVIRATSSGAGRLVTRVFPDSGGRVATHGQFGVDGADAGQDRRADGRARPGQGQAGEQLAPGLGQFGGGQHGHVVLTHRPASHGRPARRSHRPAWPGAGPGPEARGSADRTTRWLFPGCGGNPAIRRSSARARGVLAGLRGACCEVAMDGIGWRSSGGGAGVVSLSNVAVPEHNWLCGGGVCHDGPRLDGRVSRWTTQRAIRLHSLVPSCAVRGWRLGFPVRKRWRPSSAVTAA
jgi:hypothetical protein